MNANQVKHAAGLEAWRQRIVECRASGRSVREWCAAYGCSPSTYYRWEREIFGGLKRPQSALSESEQALVPCQRQTLVELPVGAPDNPELSIPKGHALALNERKRLQAAPPDVKPAAQNGTQDDASAFRPVAVLRIGGADSWRICSPGPTLSRIFAENLNPDHGVSPAAPAAGHLFGRTGYLAITVSRADTWLRFCLYSAEPGGRWCGGPAPQNA